jgi:hypothetical protein
VNSKLLNFITLLFILAACSTKNDRAEHAHTVSDSTPKVQQDTTRKSIPQEEHAQIGDAHVVIKYHAPAVRGRTIWGGLVPYGDVWVTGAHSATSFEIDKDFMVNQQQIPAGRYALFTIPDTTTWTIIINKNWDQHLADEYDPKEDVIRFTVKPDLLDEIQERLKYTVIVKGGSTGEVEITWEKIKVSFPFDVR